MIKRPCDQCPWRLANQGKKHAFGFYTKSNLRRLWNQIRKGGGEQSCHLTDPNHPDHVVVGAKLGATPQECPGSVIVVLREVERMADAQKRVEPEGIDRYLSTRKKGLTKSGMRYWLLQRIQFGHVPLIGGPPLPSVNVNDSEIGLPEHLREGR